MNRYLSYILFSVLLLCSNDISGQRLEALQIQLEQATSDSLLPKAYYDLSFYYSRYNIDQCLSYVDSARIISERLGDVHHQDIADYYTGICYNRNGQYDLALTSLGTALSKFEAKKDTATMVDITYQMALVHRQRSEYIPFLDRINTSLEYARLIKYDQKVGMCLNAKLIHFSERNMLKDAEEVGLASLAIFESIKDSSSMGDVYNNLGNLKTKEGKLEEAIAYHTKQHELNTILNNIWGLGYSHSKLGNIYIKQGNLTKAEYHLLEGLSISRSQKSPYEISGSLVKCSGLYLQKKEYAKALSLAVEAEQITAEKRIGNVRGEALLLISQIYEAQGETTKALATYKKYADVKSNTLNETIAEQLSEMETKYKTVQKEEEIKRLSLEDELNQSKISQQRSALIGSIVGIALLTFLLFRIFGQKQEISSKNLIISEALSDKEILLKEIHHRVKNNLQVVSSLLRIQSNETDDEVAIEALKEGQSRVQSMSLIHQSLYQKDNLTGIKMKDYMEKLITSLFQTYKVSKNEIKISSNIADLHLDVETVVPLGLIINELITNSLKYAFPDGRQGKIKVSLTEDQDQLSLQVEDDGIGTTGTLGSSSSDSFGYGLIEAFCNKLNGEMYVDNKNGTSVVIRIKNYIKI